MERKIRTARLGDSHGSSETLKTASQRGIDATLTASGSTEVPRFAPDFGDRRSEPGHWRNACVRPRTDARAQHGKVKTALDLS